MSIQSTGPAGPNRPGLFAFRDVPVRRDMFEHHQQADPVYRKSVFGGDAVLGLIVLTILIAAIISPHAPWLAAGICFVVGVGYFVGLIRVVTAAPVGPGEFVCRIDHKMIECICPDERYGESFQLDLIQIVKLERMPGAESHGWHIFDVYGRRYWLTNHYGNPADTFAKLIENGNLAVDVDG